MRLLLFSLLKFSPFFAHFCSDIPFSLQNSLSPTPPNTPRLTRSRLKWTELDRNGLETDRNGSDWTFFKLSGVGRGGGLSAWGGGGGAGGGDKGMGVREKKENHHTFLLVSLFCVFVL